MEASQQNCYDCCLTTTKTYARKHCDLSELEHFTPRPLSPLSPAEALESLPPATPSDGHGIQLHHHHPFHSGFRCPPSTSTTTAAVKAATTNTTGGSTTSIHTSSRLGYPSPPSTTSDPKHSVPLPTAPPLAVAPPSSSTALVSARRRGTSMNSPDDYDIYYDLHNDTTATTTHTTGHSNHRAHHHAHHSELHFFGGLLDSPVIQHRALITRPTTTATKGSSSSASLSPPRARQRRRIRMWGPPSRFSPTSPPRSTLSSKKRKLSYHGEWAGKGKDCYTGDADHEGDEEDPGTASWSDLLSPLSPEWESHALECYLPSPPSISAPASLSRFFGGLSCLGEGRGEGGDDERDCDCDSDSATCDLSSSTPSPRISPLLPSPPQVPAYTNTTASSTGPLTKPALPLLDIPQPSFTFFRSYAPSPSSSLWFAEDRPPLFSTPLQAAEDGDEGEHDHEEDAGYNVSDDEDEERYLVSPPSSGPPETPSPEERSNTRLRPLLDGLMDDLFNIEEEDMMGLSEGEGERWKGFGQGSGDDQWVGLWGKGMEEEEDEDEGDETMMQEDFGVFGMDDDSPRYLEPTIPNTSDTSTATATTPPQPDVFIDDPPPHNGALHLPPAPSLPPSAAFQPVLDNTYRHFDEDDHRLLQSPSSAFRTCSDLPELAEDEEMGADGDVCSAGHEEEEEVMRRSSPFPRTVESEDESDSLGLLFGSHLPSSPYTLSPPPATSLSPRTQQDELDLLSVDRDILTRLPLPPMEREEVMQLVGLQQRAREAERAVWEVEGLMKGLLDGEGGSTGLVGEDNGTRVDEGEVDEFGLLSPPTSDDALRERDGEKERKRRLRELKDLLVERRAFAKREREKAREAGVLVRLKLEEQGVLRMLYGEDDMPGLSSPSSLMTSPSSFLGGELLGDLPSSTSEGTGVPSGSGSGASGRQHPRMASIAHLVAKMFLNRHQAPTTPPLLNSIPALSPAPREYSTASSSSDTSSASPPERKYKYRPLWLKGLEAAASSSPSASSSSSPSSSTQSPSVPARSRTTGSIPPPSPSIHSRSRSGRGRASTFPLLNVGIGLGSTMPFLEQAYQKRYKFLRSSPLARSSCTVPPEGDASFVEEEEGGESGEDGEKNGKMVSREEEAGRLIEGLGDIDGVEGGFEALSRPILWGAEEGDGEG